MKRRIKPTCAKCGEPRDKAGQAYCRRCHATYMRNRRAQQVTISRAEYERLIAGR